MKKFYILVLAVLLSSCTAITLQKSGNISVDGKYIFETSVDWNQSTIGAIHSLTLDGFALQSLQISAGIKGDQKLLPELGESPQPKFEKTLTLLNMQDFVRDSFIAVGAERFVYESFSPANFGTWPGFRASYSFFTKDGLKKRGLIVGAIHDEALYTVNYIAAAVYYYDRTLPEVEKIIGSIKPIEKTS